MKNLLLFILLAACCLPAVHSLAQPAWWPRYYYVADTGRSGSGALGFGGSTAKYPDGSYKTIWNSWGKNGFGDSTKPCPGPRMQSWYPKDTAKSFKNPLNKPAPNGLITNVYFRSGGTFAKPGEYTTYYDFKIKMGNTDQPALPVDVHSTQTDTGTFYTGLQDVYTAKVLYKDYSLSAGQWIKFPVSNFYYSHDHNLVVEISAGSKAAINPIYLNASLRDTSNNLRQTIRGVNDTTKGNTHVFAMEFGFDVQTVGVESVGNITSVGVFPNPSKDHKVMLSLDGREVFKEIGVQVINALGQQVYSRVFQKQGSSFLEQIDLRVQPAGIYQVNVSTGGECLSRRLSLE